MFVVGENAQTHASKSVDDDDDDGDFLTIGESGFVGVSMSSSP